MIEKTDAETARARWLTSVIGGALLTLAGLFLLARFLLVAQPLAIAGAAMLAVGIGRGGSIVGPKPLGRVALILSAVLVFFIAPMLESLAVQSMYLSYLGGVHPSVVLTVSFGVLIATALVGVTTALIAGVRIGRAGVVPRPWAWLPLPIMIGAVLTSLGMTAITSVSALSWMAAFSEEYVLLDRAQMLGTIVLGVLALALGLRERFRAVPSTRVHVESDSVPVS